MPSSSKIERAEAKYDVTLNYPNLELHSAAANGNVGLVHYALTHGQPVNSVLHGVLPLHAAASGGSEPVVRMLIDRGADVNAPRLPRRYGDAKKSVGHSGSTPLHFAAANGHARIVRILLASGAIHDKQDKHGNTPLTLAEANHHEEVVDTLLTWTALLEEEKEKIKTEMAEEQGAGNDAALEDDFEDAPSPVLEKQGRWRGKARAVSDGGKSTETDKQERQLLRKSIDNLFHGRRHNSALRPLSQVDVKRTPSDSSAASGRSGRASASAVPPHVQGEEIATAGGRRPSLPSIFERASHPGQSLRAALRRGHGTQSVIEDDTASFSAISRRSTFDDGASVATSSSQPMSKQGLLQLFRRGTHHSGSPPSRSPSPTHHVPLPLSPAELDESVEKLRRASLEGSRPGSGGSGRPRSASQVTFQDSIMNMSSAASTHSGGSSSQKHRQAGHSPLLGISDDKGEADVPTSQLDHDVTPSADVAAAVLTGSAVSDVPLDARHLPRQRSRLSSEVAVPSPLGLGAEPGTPRSILKVRTNGALSPPSQGSPATSPTSTKPRSATLPTSYFPQPRPKSSGSGTRPSASDIASHDPFAAGENTVKPARSRGASIGSMRSSAGSYRGSPTATPPVTEEPDGQQEGDVSGPETAQKPTTSPRHEAKYGRRRNKSISSTSSMTSYNGFTTSTQATSYTPSNGHSPVLEHAPEIVKPYIGRRTSKRLAEAGLTLYPPAPRPSTADSLAGRRISTRAEAQDAIRESERQILEAVTTPALENGGEISLSAQLAAFGDTFALAQELAMTEADSTVGTPSADVPAGQVSRSYIRRPPSIRNMSAESNATIVDTSSKQGSSNGKQSASGSADNSAGGVTQQKRSVGGTGSEMSVVELRVRNADGGQSARKEPPEPIYVPNAPGSALPSINRIYESRAAAYRDRGKKLANTAPIFASGSNTRRASSANNKISFEDHWINAGSKQARSVSSGGPSDSSRPPISLPMAQTNASSSAGKVAKKRRSSSDTRSPSSDWDGRPTMRSGVRSPQASSITPKASEATFLADVEHPVMRSSRSAASPSTSTKSSPPRKADVASSTETTPVEPKRRTSSDMMTSRLGKMVGSSARRPSADAGEAARRSTESKRGSNSGVSSAGAEPVKHKWSIKSAFKGKK